MHRRRHGPTLIAEAVGNIQVVVVWYFSAHHFARFSFVKCPGVAEMIASSKHQSVHLGLVYADGMLRAQFENPAVLKAAESVISRIRPAI
jgi:hypothetical protein